MIFICTAVTVKTVGDKWFFGRNMDLAYDFNEAVYMVPKDYSVCDMVKNEKITAKYSVIGMGTMIDGRLVFADGMNEKGLAVCGLNFEGYARYEKEIQDDKINIPPYDFMTFMLFNYSTVAELIKDISRINLVEIPINDTTEVATLHWMVTDKSGQAYVIEKTKEGIKAYKNTVYVLTNNPTFDWHLTNLREYLYVKPASYKPVKWCNEKLVPLGVGNGNLGIPGDFSSVSRFVRIAYLRANLVPLETSDEAIMQCLNMLDYVKMVKGGVLTEDKKQDYTRYSACMDLENKTYYYKTYNGSEIKGIRLKKETEKLQKFQLSKAPTFRYEN